MYGVKISSVWIMTLFLPVPLVTIFIIKSMNWDQILWITNVKFYDLRPATIDEVKKTIL